MLTKIDSHKDKQADFTAKESIRSESIHSEAQTVTPNDDISDKESIHTNPEYSEEDSWDENSETENSDDEEDIIIILNSKIITIISTYLNYILLYWSWFIRLNRDF